MPQTGQFKQIWACQEIQDFVPPFGHVLPTSDGFILCAPHRIVDIQ